FFSSRRRHTRSKRDWSSDVCSSDLVTSKGELIREDLLKTIYRGITITEGYGGYTQEKKDILMTVVTRHEMSQIKEIIRKHDETAFINIFETVEVDGVFAKN